MSHEILINVTPQETRVAMLEQGVVQEFHIERSSAREVVERLNTTMNAGLADPTLKRRLAELGCLVYPGTPAAMTTFVAREIDKWAKVIRTAGIKPE